MSSESPFKKKKRVFVKERSLIGSAYDNAKDQLNNFFMNNIPSESVKQLPPQYLYPIGAIILLLLVGIFVAVFVPGYTVALRTKYLSPVDSGSSQYCEDVTISNTGTFLATKTGSWQGSSSFAYSNATYQINLVNVQMDKDYFASTMTKIFLSLSAVGKYVQTQGLATSLLYWMTWVYVGSNLERFSMTGTPLMIFQREHTVGTISNQVDDCNATSVGTFDPSTGVMQLSYRLDEFITNPSCAGNGNPAHYGYSSLTHVNTFNVNFDVRTLITAVAVNVGVIDAPTQLQLIDSVYYRIDGALYYSASYVDPRYPGMRPVLCLFRDDVPYCLVSIGAMYGIPVFDHIGSNLTHPAQCNCTQIQSNPADYYNPCNFFNFLTGVIVWPNAPLIPNPALELMLNKTPKEIYSLSFKPMYTAGAFGMGSPERNTFNSLSQRAEMYAFCNSDTYGTCSMVTFSSYDSSLNEHVVSPNYYSIDYGACADTLSTDEQSWYELVGTPFAPLTQEYQTCRNDPFTTFITQAGASAGNVTLLSPGGVLIVLGILALYQMCTGKVIPRAYSPGEKSEALDALAVALLLIRDKRIVARQNNLKTITTKKLRMHNTAGGVVHGASSGDHTPLSALSAASSVDGDHDESDEGSCARLGPDLRDERKGRSTITSANFASSASSASNTGGGVGDTAELDVGLLAELVDQLSNIAPAMERYDLVYRNDGGEPIKVNWDELATKVRSPLGFARSAASNSSSNLLKLSRTSDGGKATEMTTISTSKV